MVKYLRDKLDSDVWPSECQTCQIVEETGRGDSIRLNSSYSCNHYETGDLMLDFRPGSTCNLACQVCWPEFSSRIRAYYQKAGIPYKINDPDVFGNFDFLNKIQNQLRDITIMGGEPFYDQNCLKFLDWVVDKKLSSNIIILTNGTGVNFDFLEKYQGQIILVFSIDAAGRPAEYIRFGTVWTEAHENYVKSKTIPNVRTRVNITTSPYNYWYLPELLLLLASDWPEVVSFGVTETEDGGDFMDESVVPPAHRSDLIEKLSAVVSVLENASIEHFQKINAKNAVTSIIANLKDWDWDLEKFHKFYNHVQAMDRVKKISIADYCPEVHDMFKFAQGI
jgi:sulfatase maturation enzyme AslB (radical SAM superfamily)